MSDFVGAPGPCVALLELSSIATGIEVTDGLGKEAAVDLLFAKAVSPGKFVILFAGPVEEVTSALRRGREVGGDYVLDQLFIPNLEPTLLQFLLGTPPPLPGLDAVGLIETDSVASTVRAADIASKTGSLMVVALHLARGIGGKSWMAVTGEVSDVESAIDEGAADAESQGMLVRRVVIPRPHSFVRDALES
ncbi:MAG: BMC domain-containing protein [Planctomycetota bacterium]|nr:BMC domain-containing protein [Planctomycetota bacterium]